MQQGKPIECNIPQYEHVNCEEYNHLQMARCVNKADGATLSTKMQSIHRTYITVGCQ